MIRERMIAIFDEWLKRYNADPDEFVKLADADSSYGESCVNYMAKLNEELPQ